MEENVFLSSGKQVPCELCASLVSLEQGNLPLTCPHCGKRLRPATNSMWSHFIFVLLHRPFTRKGRATRKEYWSYVFFSSIPYIVITLIIGFVILPHTLSSIRLFLVSFSILTLLYMLPLVSLTARRLHDFGISGFISHLYYAISFLELGIFSFAALNFLETYNNSYESFVWITEYAWPVSAEYSLDFDSEYTLLCNEEYVQETLMASEDEIDSLSEAPLMLLLSGVSSCLGFFLLIAAFINSEKGSNKYGISRKYLSYS